MTTTSNIPQDLETTRNLTRAEQRAELATARAIVAEALAFGGFSEGFAAGVSFEMSARLTSSMGNARTDSFVGRLTNARPAGRVKLSASALWLHASPTKRRNTVIHELAHVMANHEAGRSVGHGPGWKAMMRRLGEVPKRCHSVPKARPTRRRRVPSAAVDSLAMLLGRAAAERIHAPRPSPAAAKFSRGQVVLVGRARGEKTRCRITRVNGKSLGLETLEARAGRPAGMKMRASFSLCEAVD